MLDAATRAAYLTYLCESLPTAPSASARCHRASASTGLPIQGLPSSPLSDGLGHLGCKLQKKPMAIAMLAIATADHGPETETTHRGQPPRLSRKRAGSWSTGPYEARGATRNFRTEVAEAEAGSRPRQSTHSHGGMRHPGAEQRRAERPMGGFWPRIYVVKKGHARGISLLLQTARDVWHFGAPSSLFTCCYQ
jgi:hypothetical protein